MNTNNKKGLSFTSVLVIILIVLKITNLIDWSWWWVFAPFWVQSVAILVVILVITVVDLILEYKIRNKQ